MSTGGFGGATKDPGEVKTAAASTAQVPANIEALRFDRVKNLVGLLGVFGPYIGQIQELLSKIDVSKLPTLLASIQELFSAEGLKARVLAGLKLAQIYVTITPGERDDQLLSQISKIVGNDALLDILVGMLEKLTGAETPATSGNVSALSVEALGTVVTAEQTATFEAAGFDLNSVLTIAKLLLSIWQAVKPLIPKPAPKPE